MNPSRPERFVLLNAIKILTVLMYATAVMLLLLVPPEKLGFSTRFLSVVVMGLVVGIVLLVQPLRTRR